MIVESPGKFLNLRVGHHVAYFLDQTRKLAFKLSLSVKLFTYKRIEKAYRIFELRNVTNGL